MLVASRRTGLLSKCSSGSTAFLHWEESPGYQIL